jgi:hypothetical protein
MGARVAMAMVGGLLLGLGLAFALPEIFPYASNQAAFGSMVFGFGIGCLVAATVRDHDTR